MRLQKQHLTAINVVIPDTAQWQRIRRKWGAPEYVVSAVSTSRRDAYCLTDLNIGVAVSEHGQSCTDSNLRSGLRLLDTVQRELEIRGRSWNGTPDRHRI